MPEVNYAQTKGREKFLENPPFDAREILYGKPLFEFIAAEYSANQDSTDEDLFTNIHAKWLMTERADLGGKMPREFLLEKHDFISADLHSRFLQWSFTKHQTPPLSKDTNAYKFAGFGTQEFVVYYDLIRYLLSECFENDIESAEKLEAISKIV